MNYLIDRKLRNEDKSVVKVRRLDMISLPKVRELGVFMPIYFVKSIKKCNFAPEKKMRTRIMHSIIINNIIILSLRLSKFGVREAM